MSITSYAASPYFDNFSSVEDKNYLQILFRPGYSVQVRELNQLQSILRAQIDKFGTSVYKNGNAVIDGSTTFDKNISYVDIETIDAISSPSIRSLGIVADVLKYELLADTINTTYRYFIRYRSSTQDPSTGENLQSFLIGEPIYLGDDDDESIAIGQIVEVGYALGTFLNKGVFFINGSFVVTDAQQAFLPLTDKDELLSGFAGFKITETVVNALADNDLYDNATGSPNFKAPGADRYSIGLDLVFVKDTDILTYTFIKLFSFVENKVVDDYSAKKTSKFLDNVLAQRTFEESGNYSVRPFKIDIKEYFNDGTNFGKYTLAKLPPDIDEATAKTKYIAGIEPSVAYVNGYRIQLTERNDLVADKARTYETIENVVFTARQGNYITTDTLPDFANNSTLPDISSTSATYSLYTAAGATVIGYCKIRNIEYVSATVYNIFVYDVVIFELYNLSQATVLSLSETGTTDNFINSTGFKLYETNNNTNLFKLPYDAVKSITNIRYSVRKRILTAALGANATSIVIDHPTDPAGTIEDQTPTNYIVIDHTGNVLVPTAISINGAAATLTIPPAAAGIASVIFPYTINTAAGNPAWSNKTATSASETSTAGCYSTINRSVSFTDSGDIVTLANHGLPNGTAVYFSSIASTTGITTNTTYYVVTALTNTFQLASSIGGNALPLASNGTGVMVAPYIGVAFSGGTAKTVTVANHGLPNGTAVYFSTISAVTGISVNTVYYVINTATNTFQLAPLRGGTIPIPFTSTVGTGILRVNTTIQLSKTDVSNVVIMNGASNITSSFDINYGLNSSTCKYVLLTYIGVAPLPSPSLTISYDYYSSSSSGFPFVVNSYPTFDTIPSHDNLRLSDCIDFRFNSSDVSAISIDSNSTIIATISRYLPRVDNVLVNSAGQFYVSEGNPAINPVAPEVPRDAMRLYTTYVPAYTYSASDIIPQYIENKRYTMRDIGNLEKRVSNVEYYTSLSLLERSAKEKQILAAGAYARYKNGILVDSFLGHNIGDVENPGYACAIDAMNGILRPQYSATSIDLKLPIIIPTGLVSNKNTTLVSYNHVKLIEQSQAVATAESVNPYDMTMWNGNVELSPSSDEWKSTTVRPDVIINDSNAYDAIVNLADETKVLGTQWNEWEINWSGISTSTIRAINPDNGGSMRQTSTVSQSSSIRDGIRTSLSYTDNTQSLGEKIVDISYVPFIRSRKIYFTASKLKPNTRVYPFFDGVDISAYTAGTAITHVEFKNNTNRDSYDGASLATLTAPGGVLTASNVVSDEFGNANGYFIIPNNSSLRFKTGERSFKLIDSTTVDSQDFTTVAETKYFAAGILETKQSTIISTRVPKFDTTKISETRTNADVPISVKWDDPLAQSFILGANLNRGAYITKIDLFFKNKSTKNIPISVHIVSMENGMPTQNIVPFTTVVKYPGDVLTSDDSSLATAFDFASPVYLQPGVEYAIVVMSNDADYKLFVSSVGSDDITSANAVISKNPYAGVLFKSQNGSTWTADQNKDLKFTIWRASFNDAQVATEIQLTGVDTTTNPNEYVSFSMIKTTVENLTHSSGDITWKLKIGNDIIQNIDINTTVDLGKVYTAKRSDVKIIATVDTDNEYLSPYIDCHRMSIVLIKNIINNTTTNELLADSDGATARYITRSVVLNDPANQLDIFMGVNNPSNTTNVKLYTKVKLDDSTPFDLIPWVEVSPIAPGIIINSDVNVYNEVAYKYIPSAKFSQFSIKIVMLNSEVNGPFVPAIKDFRAIATYA